MDILAHVQSRFCDQEGPSGILEYQLLRSLAQTPDGSPLCEVYGLRVIRRVELPPEVYSIEGLTTDYDYALKLLETLAHGQVEPVNAADVLYDLIVQ